MKRIYRALKTGLATLLLRRGGRLIDLEWYREQNLQNAYCQRFALVHALLFSHRATARSHPLFCPEYFVEQCEKAGLAAPKNPLKTYLRDRCYWHVDTHPLFDTHFYTNQISPPLEMPPLLHFLDEGHLQFDPHPLFQRTWYLISYPGLKKMQRHCALLHYLKIGYRAAASTHPLFHAFYYAEQAGILLKDGTSNQDLLLHYVTSSSFDISCHPLFSPQYFFRQVPTNSKTRPYNTIIKEYLLKPENWALSTHILFDSQYYLAQNSGKVTDKSPLAEYIEYNFRYRNPHPLFNTQWYLGRNRDLERLKGQGCVPLVHFVMNGYKMGESPHALFALQWYRHTYMQGRLDNVNPLIEFLTAGEGKGNRPNPLYPANWKTLLQEKYQCSTLEEYARNNPTGLPSRRNRISDIFATKYLNSDINIQDIKNYIILFTPRSGSSWLTELISDRKTLGRPSEWFNPDLMQSAMNGFYRKSENIYEYCSALQDRHKSAEGFFGAELTAKHLSLLIELVNINAVFNNPIYILQLRQNIISQAVSLFLATETGFFHASNTINSNNTVEYNGLKIQNWAKKLLQQEKFLCQFLNRQETPYLISWYEDLQKSPEEVVDRIAEYITGTRIAERSGKPHVNAKVGSGVNLTFEARFREEQPSLVAEIEAARPFLHSIDAGKPD